MDDNQVFVYEVKNQDTNDIVTVTVVGNSSTVIQNLAYGTYEVTEIDDWSWRYGGTKQEVKIGVEGQDKSQSVVFKNRPAKKNWLNGNSPLIVNRGAGGS
jgi:hypothetical protein